MARSIIIFDMDGTLVETMPRLIQICLDLARALQPQADEDGLRRRITDIMHLPPARLVSELSALLGWQVSEFHAKIGEIMPRLPPTLFPEVPEVLTSLKAAGYTLMLSSNTPENALQERLKTAGIAGDFDFILGTNVAAGITKEDHPRLAAEHLSLTEKDFAAVAVFVGDTPGDMVMAKRAGLLAIGRVSENEDELRREGADHLIKDLTEVESLIR
jgi:phosphoglycolate phosphatase-like HAD superfamily hydrolase